MIRVLLPPHLRILAVVQGEIDLQFDAPPTIAALLEAIENRYPVLRGSIRDHGTLKRRPFIRFFACEQDLSHELPEVLLPEAVATGAEPLLIIGAMAGG